MSTGLFNLITGAEIQKIAVETPSGTVVDPAGGPSGYGTPPGWQQTDGIDDKGPKKRMGRRQGRTADEPDEGFPTGQQFPEPWKLGSSNPPVLGPLDPKPRPKQKNPNTGIWEDVPDSPNWMDKASVSIDLFHGTPYIGLSGAHENPVPFALASAGIAGAALYARKKQMDRLANIEKMVAALSKRRWF